MMRLPRRLRLTVLAGLALLLMGAGVLGRRGLRELDALRVRRVEVVGTLFLEPYAVVRAAGLDRESSIVDDAGSWKAGVLTLPLVKDVRVRRKLPATVELVVTEVEPVAFTGGGELRAVDANGWLIPVDPAGLNLDLPLLSGVPARSGRLTAEGGGLQALEVLMTLRREAPEIAERVSQIERRGGMLRVVFRDQAAEALLPLDATGLQVGQLRLAYADLVSRAELPLVRRIDLRFRDQVVVSFIASP